MLPLSPLPLLHVSLTRCRDLLAGLFLADADMSLFVYGQHRRGHLLCATAYGMDDMSTPEGSSCPSSLSLYTCKYMDVLGHIRVGVYTRAPLVLLSLPYAHLQRVTYDGEYPARTYAACSLFGRSKKLYPRRPTCKVT